ncbi:MAG: hypothetical protein R3B36_11785 [Polyangiaceae bacterium]
MPRRPSRSLPASAIASFIQPAEIDALLERVLPDGAERAFVVRCITQEGPIHHRGSSYALLRLLGVLLDELGDEGDAVADPPGETVSVRLRLPPHMAREGDDDYPLRMPTRPLDAIEPSGDRKHAALVDCLTDGPPHHALANAAMVSLLDLAITRARAKRSRDG